MTQTEREKTSGKPLGDAGSGASGGGSVGNLPGAAATGGDARQGVRSPDVPLQEPDPRLATAEAKRETDAARRPPTPMEKNNYAQADEAKGPASSEGDSANSPRPQTATEAALPSTIEKNPRPKE
ncbi:hypothetical protein [Caballeronia sp. DA-9]|uniref:hypothetical protein n=1 Tax=Caballeronia sp. DA-9 TaxID=3436237 RepID=UPI003F68217D